MELGLIGLGRMGTNMVLGLQRDGNHCAVFDTKQEAAQALAKDDFAEKLLSAFRRRFGGHEEKAAPGKEAA